MTTVEKIIWWVVLFVVLFYFVNYNMALRHELSHVAVNELAGCQESEYDVNFSGNGFTGHTECLTEIKDKESYYNAQRMNMLAEVIGYHVIILINAILSIVFVVGLFVIGGKKE